MDKKYCVENYEVKFIVDKNRRVVVAMFVPPDFFEESCMEGKVDFDFRRTHKIAYCASIPKERLPIKKLRGVAQCSADDEFDVEIGKKIAFKRLEKKFYKAYYKRARWMYENLKNALSSVEKAITEGENRMNKIDPLECLTVK